MTDQNVDPSIRLIHTTDVQKYKNCRLQWEFSSPLRRNLRPFRINPNFTFGTAWHSGLEAYYDPKQSSRSIEHAKEAFSHSLKEWFAAIDNPDIEVENDYTDFMDLGSGMLDHYGEFAVANDRFTVLWVEETFLIPIPGVEKALYTLKPDAVVADDKDRVWVMEHKSASKLPVDTEYLLMDAQCGSYILGVQVAKDIKVEGVIYNIARKKAPTPMRVLKDGSLSVDKRTDITYDYAKRQILEYHTSLAEADKDVVIPWEKYVEFLEAKKNNAFFYRENVRRNAREIEILEKMISIEVKEMLTPELLIYRNPNRFNCSGCAFIAPCLGLYEGADVELMLSTNYELNDYR